MIKNIFLISICLFTVSISYAFEGIITQVYTDVNTKEQKTFVWYISNDVVRFDIVSGEETVTILPDFKNLTLSYFGNKAGADGVNYYSTSSISEVKVNAPKLRVLEQTDSKYNDKDAKEVKLMSSEGLLVVQYLNTIPMNMKNMLTYFAESKEFQAISLVGDSGFPVSSVIMTNNEAIYTLTTKSIVEKSLSESIFKIPSNYKLFDPSTIK